MSLSRAMIAGCLAVWLCLPPPEAHALVTVGGLDLPLGQYADVEVVDGLAYVVGGAPESFLRVIDVSDPQAPVEVASLALPGRGTQIGVAGGFAYVGVEGFGLEVIDVSDPTSPVEVALLELEPVPIPITALVVTDGRVYLVDSGTTGPRSGARPSLLRVIDVSDPRAPVQLGVLSNDVIVENIEVAGSIVYARALSPGSSSGYFLLAIDVSDPSEPVLIAAVPTPTAVGAGLAVSGDLAYLPGTVGINEWGLQVFDVADPLAPVEMGSVAAGCCFAGGDVEVAGGRAYVAFGNGVQVFDVSNPTAPSALGTIGVDALKVELGATLAYTIGYGGLRIVDVSRPERPVELGAYQGEVLDIAHDVEVVGDLAYVATSPYPSIPGSTGGLSIVDVSDPRAPVQIGLEDLEPAFDVAVVNHLAFVAAGEAGLRVIDVSHPDAPVEIGRFADLVSAARVVVVGDLAYVAETDPLQRLLRSLQVLDVSDPTAPVRLGSIEPGSLGLCSPRVGLAVSDALAYVSCPGFNGSLAVIDVSSPASPVVIGGAPVPAAAIALRGTLAWTVGSTLRSLDVSDPTTPVEIGFAPLFLRGLAIAMNRDLVLVEDALGLQAFDASDPAAPRERGGFPLPFERTGGIAAAHGLVYVADGSYGLRIIDLGPEYAAPLEIGIDIKPGDDANAVNPASRGVVPVAILGSEGFDVADVDVSTLAFGPGGAPLAHRNGPHRADVDGDGVTDLLAHFAMQETGIAAGDPEACLTGRLLDGTPIEGCDRIRTTPRASGFGFALALVVGGLLSLRRSQRRPTPAG